MFYHDTPPSQTQENIFTLGLLAACNGTSGVIQCDGVSLKRELYWVIYSPPQRLGQDYSVLWELPPNQFPAPEAVQPIQPLWSSCQAAFLAAQPKPPLFHHLAVAPHHTSWWPFPKCLFHKWIMRSTDKTSQAYLAWKATAEQLDCASCKTTQKC